VSRETIADQGWQCLCDEWEFNERAGLGPDSGAMAECMKTDGVGPDHSVVFDVADEVVREVYVRKGNREELFAIKATG